MPATRLARHFFDCSRILRDYALWALLQSSTLTIASVVSARWASQTQEEWLLSVLVCLALDFFVLQLLLLLQGRK